MGIFLQSRRNIRNCALFGNFSFYFSFSAEKELLLMFRLFFGRKRKNHFRSTSNTSDSGGGGVSGAARNRLVQEMVTEA